MTAWNPAVTVQARPGPCKPRCRQPGGGSSAHARVWGTRRALGSANKTCPSRPSAPTRGPAAACSRPRARPKQAPAEGRRGRQPWAEARGRTRARRGPLPRRPPAPAPARPGLAPRSRAPGSRRLPRAGPRPEPRAPSPRLRPPARAPRAPRSAAGPPLGRFRFRFPAAVAEENESDRGRGSERRGCRPGEGRSELRRRPAWSPRAGEPASWGRGPHPARWQHALDVFALPVVLRQNRREARKWTPFYSLQCEHVCARICNLLEENNIKTSVDFLWESRIELSYKATSSSLPLVSCLVLEKGDINRCIRVFIEVTDHR
ncbi:translation initiation factor IF-2-like [Vulpes lagopus]|uniref:translation initiation factor IF-2-like n=1 Tax=Vulpes lagopus TaxID=494514 RepID=UPI001BC9C196|nr:translation initiation factor IF-2-like [Vulpes lagopus]